MAPQAEAEPRFYLGVRRRQGLQARPRLRKLRHRVIALRVGAQILGLGADPRLRVSVDGRMWRLEQAREQRLGAREQRMGARV